MILNKINSYSVDILLKSGWYRERKFDASSWICILEEEGYQINAYAKEILEELGDIYVGQKCCEEYEAATFNFNPILSASGEFDRMELFENISKDKLFPIGQVQDYILYAGASKNIYIGDWEGLYIIGNTIEEFLTNIFLKGYEPIRV